MNHNTDQNDLPSSDVRCISSIEPFSMGLPLVDQLSFVSYVNCSNQQKIYVGLISQEVKKVAPDMVYSEIGYLSTVQCKVTHLSVNDIVELTVDNLEPCMVEGAIINLQITPKQNPFPYYYRVVIQHINEHTIEISKWPSYSAEDTICIYGTQVDDLQSIDTSQMGMLGAACAKELYHIVKEQSVMIKTLQEQVTALQAKLS
jgi:hypothetical protein